MCREVESGAIMEMADRERDALARLRSAGRAGAAVFAMTCIERLRPLLDRVPSGAPALVAGVALTQLWRVLEGAERPDPRRRARCAGDVSLRRPAACGPCGAEGLRGGGARRRSRPGRAGARAPGSGPP